MAIPACHTHLRMAGCPRGSLLQGRTEHLPTFVPVEATYTTYNTCDNSRGHSRPRSALLAGEWGGCRRTCGHARRRPVLHQGHRRPCAGQSRRQCHRHHTDPGMGGCGRGRILQGRVEHVRQLRAGGCHLYHLQPAAHPRGRPGAQHLLLAGQRRGCRRARRSNNWRKFTLVAPPAATDATPQLLAPADGDTITTDPTFTWSRLIGADHYRLIVSTDADFHPTYDSVHHDYNSYTPAVARPRTPTPTAPTTGRCKRATAAAQ